MSSRANTHKHMRVHERARASTHLRAHPCAAHKHTRVDTHTGARAPCRLAQTQPSNHALARARGYTTQSRNTLR
eukprot:957726-Pleurochrysis_carterae.AAC.1